MRVRFDDEDVGVHVKFVGWDVRFRFICNKKNHPSPTARLMAALKEFVLEVHCASGSFATEMSLEGRFSSFSS